MRNRKLFFILAAIGGFSVAAGWGTPRGAALWLPAGAIVLTMAAAVLFLWVSGRRLWVPAALLFGAGMGLSFAVSVSLENAAIQNGYKKFVRAADDRISVFERELKSDLWAVEIVDEFFRSLGYVDREQFRRFAEILMQDVESIHSLQWALKVPRNESGKMNPLTGFVAGDIVERLNIREIGPDGEMRPAGDREWYYPVYYVEPNEPNRKLLGYDLGSEPGFAEIFEIAGQKGSPVVTPPVELVRGQGERTGVLSVFPVYASEKRDAGVLGSAHKLEGFLIGVFDIHQILEVALNRLAAEPIGFVMQDVTDSASPLFVCSTEPDVRVAAHGKKEDFGHEVLINVAGRSWEISAVASSNLYTGSLVWLARAAGLAVYIFALSILNVLSRNVERTRLIEEKVAERTRELSEAMAGLEREARRRQSAQLSLQTKTQELEAANRELDGFVYTASHDLRSPLRDIAVTADRLAQTAETRLDPASAELVERLRRQARRMENLIRDLLTLSRITRIRNPYEKVRTQDVVASVIEELKDTPDGARAKIEVDPDLPVIECDRIKIRQVFYNLVSNAAKFSSGTGAGGGEIRIGGAVRNDTAEFFVRDNGIGIPERSFAKIFDMFIRLHTQDEYEGTGAGLAIVKRIIEEHGGTIRVESEAGRGSTFVFRLPLEHPAGSRRDLGAGGLVIS
ncbi:MAG: CHASE domain-containing protein [Candidatus Omnitrophica bacterium]|nr:CHASE domain-containing protein [Candidatus Omnitrophota bacterium]